MLTFYCPNCWETLNSEVTACPLCGFSLEEYSQLDFEGKLLRSLRHPILEKRNLAIQILGNLGSAAALPELERILADPQADIYTLREVVIALGKIPGPRSKELLRKALQHPSPLLRRLAERALEG